VAIAPIISGFYKKGKITIIPNAIANPIPKLKTIDLKIFSIHCPYLNLNEFLL
jgi:hypothetical protein